MDALAIYAHTFLDWLLRTTCQASLVICLVLLVQRALRHKLGVRARYLLWLVVVVRMALPWAPESRLSVYNLLPSAPLQGYKAVIGPDAEGGPSHLTIRDEIDAAKPHDPAGTTSASTFNSAFRHSESSTVLTKKSRTWRSDADQR